MKPGRANQPARRGFTLVELLVVIAIITVLMSLLLAAVMRSVIKTEEVKTRNDISQLEQAIASFKIKYNVNYIPSRIVLREKLKNYSTTDALEKDSIAYLRQVWPRLGEGTTTNDKIDWNGDHTISGHYVLEGDQCLVFFLGGIPSGNPNSPACTGFSTNPTNPADTTKDRNTFYDFPTNRLVVGPNGFYSFKDAYGKKDNNRTSVYAYFSAYKTPNGYNRYYAYDGKSDCQTLGIWPYAEHMDTFPNGKYLSPNSYQIISAGRDKQYGPGTKPGGQVWTPKSPGAFASPPAADDMVNFHDRPLGIPAN